MKKLIPVLFLLLPAFWSCLKETTIVQDDSGLEIIERYLNTKSYEVPVMGDGTVTEVVYHRADGERETLAMTDIPVTIDIPAWLGQSSIVRSAAAPEPGEAWLEIINHAKGTIDFEANSFIKDGSSVLAFEDSRLGDFDYNDLVLYVKHSVAGGKAGVTQGKLTLWVKPIALGGANRIAFGWEDGNGEHILTDDVRRDYFFGAEGFVNTYTDKPMVEAIPVVDDGSGNTACDGYTIFRDRSTMVRARSENPVSDLIVGGYFKYDPVPTTCSSDDNANKAIKYFIRTSGFKFYVASIDKGAPEGTFPYGVAIPDAFYHSQERVPIWEAYPGFKSWILTGEPVNWNTSRDKTKCYEKHVNYARW